MAEVKHMLGTVLSPVVRELSEAIEPGRYESSSCCGEPMLGGTVHINRAHHFVHKTHCGHCGKAHTVHHSAAKTRKMVAHMATPDGLAHIKHVADMHGAGFWDMLKPALKTVVGAVLPQATTWAQGKLGALVDKHLGSEAGDLARAGIGKLSSCAQSKLAGSGVGLGADWEHMDGGGPSFATMEQERGAHHSRGRSRSRSGIRGHTPTHSNPWIQFKMRHPGVPLKQLSQMYQTIR